MSSPVTRILIVLVALAAAGWIGWQLIHQRQMESRVEDQQSKAEQLLEQGRFAESERYLQEAVTDAHKFGENDPRLEKSLMALADAQLSQGKYVEAAGSYMQVMAIAVARYGAFSAPVATVQARIGEAYLASGDLANAEGLFVQSIDTWEHLNAINDVVVIPSFDGLARTYEKQGKLDKAEDYLNRAIAIIDRLPDSDKGVQARVLRNLARVMEARGKDGSLLLKRAGEIEPTPTAAPTIEPTVAEPTVAPTETVAPTQTPPQAPYQGRVP